MPNRIAEWRRKRGLTLEQLATLAGTTNQQVSRLETGQRKLTEDWMRRLGRALGIAPADLMRESVTPDTDPVRDIPVISWVSAGKLIEVVDSVPAGWAESTIPVATTKTNLFGLRVEGGSMNRIAPPGCVVVVDPSDRDLQARKFYVILVDGQATFKRFMQGPDRFEPFSFDPEHEAVAHGPGVEIVGRVIKVVTDL